MDKKEFFRKLALENLIEWGYVKAILIPSGFDYIVPPEVMKRIERGEYTKILEEIKVKTEQRKLELSK